MSNKSKIIISNILLVLGFLSITAGLIMVYIAREALIGIILTIILGVICIIVGAILWSKSKRPVVDNKIKKTYDKKTSQKTIKLKKQKKPFMSDKKWKELDEEDDEMMFIEEVVEDD